MSFNTIQREPDGICCVIYATGKLPIWWQSSASVMGENPTGWWWASAPQLVVRMHKDLLEVLRRTSGILHTMRGHHLKEKWPQKHK